MTGNKEREARRNRIIHRMAKSLQTVGSTMVALCVIGGWFTDAIHNGWYAVYGVVLGVAVNFVGAYTEDIFSREARS